MKGAWITAACALVACSDGRTRLELPPTGDAKTEILAVYRGETREVYALDLTDPSGSARFEMDGDPVEVEAWLYPESLRELGLSPGQLTSTTNDEAVPLPPPTVAYGAVLDGGDSSGWSEMSGPSARLTDFRIEKPPSICPEFQLVPIAAEHPSRPRFATALDDRSALIGTSSGAVFRVQVDGTVEPVTVEPETTVLNLLPGDDGRFVATDTTRQTWRADFSAGTLRLESVIDDGPMDNTYWDARVDADGNIEAGTTVQLGEVFYLRNGVWSEVGSFNASTPGGSRGATYVAPGHFVYSHQAFGFIIRLRGGVVTEETVIENGLVYGVAHTREFGTLAGGRLGRVYTDRSGEWTRLHDTGSGARIFTFEDYERTAVFGGQNSVGLITRIGACDLPFRHEVLHIEPVGRHILVLGVFNNDPFNLKASLYLRDEE